jgi:hypothetical protein
MVPASGDRCPNCGYTIPRGRNAEPNLDVRPSGLAPGQFAELRDAAGCLLSLVGSVFGFIVMAGLLLGALYLLVRFVKWAWEQ